MIISPSNLIEGLFDIVILNAPSINKLIRAYRRTDSLHLYKGIRTTLANSEMPSLEMEPVSGSMEWSHIGAMTGEYSIDCVLTVNCGTSIERGVEYISELTRKIVQIYNYPQNMSWIIPNESQDKKGFEILCQYSDIRSVEYASAKEFSIRVARWQITCRVLERAPHPGNLLGPAKVNWKKDYIPGSK